MRGIFVHFHNPISLCEYYWINTLVYGLSLIHIFIGDLSIDLGRGDLLMPQHLADRFQRYALLERNRRGEGMPREVDPVSYTHLRYVLRCRRADLRRLAAERLHVRRSLCARSQKIGYTLEGDVDADGWQFVLKNTN